MVPLSMQDMKGGFFSHCQFCAAGHDLRDCGAGYADAATTLVRTGNQTARVIDYCPPTRQDLYRKKTSSKDSGSLTAFD